MDLKKIADALIDLYARNLALEELLRKKKWFNEGVIEAEIEAQRAALLRSVGAPDPQKFDELQLAAFLQNLRTARPHAG